MAEECAKLLSDKREEGAKSNKKSNKREEQRDIRRRFWWVDKTEDKDLKKLKYSAVGFYKQNRQEAEVGGSHNFRYHIYCCSQLGVGRVAMRRIPCACDACNNTIRKDWVDGQPAEEQPRFKIVMDCKYRKILGERNQWTIVTLDQDKDGDDDDAELAKAETLVSLTTTLAEKNEIGNFGAIISEDPGATDGFWIVRWTGEPYADQETGELMCNCDYYNYCTGALRWFSLSDDDDSIFVTHIVKADLKLLPMDRETNWPRGHRVCTKDMKKKKAVKMSEEDFDQIFDEILRRQIVDCRPEMSNANYLKEKQHDDEDDDDKSEEEIE